MQKTFTHTFDRFFQFDKIARVHGKNTGIDLKVLRVGLQGTKGAYHGLCKLKTGHWIYWCTNTVEGISDMS